MRAFIPINCVQANMSSVLQTILYYFTGFTLILHLFNETTGYARTHCVYLLHGEDM